MLTYCILRALWQERIRIIQSGGRTKAKAKAKAEESMTSAEEGSAKAAFTVAKRRAAAVSVAHSQPASQPHAISHLASQPASQLSAAGILPTTSERASSQKEQAKLFLCLLAFSLPLPFFQPFSLACLLACLG